MALKLRPISNNVVLKEIKAGEVRSGGGIVIPGETTAKLFVQRGRVIAVGPGRPVQGVMVPTSVKVGDEVLYSKSGVSSMKMDGEDFLIGNEEEIFCVIEQRDFKDVPHPIEHMVYPNGRPPLDPDKMEPGILGGNRRK